MCNHERIYVETSSGLFPQSEPHNTSLTCTNCDERWEIDGINHFVKVN